MFHLAQLNIARFLASLDDPRMSEFAAAIDTLNRAAERFPGFVWRFDDELDAASLPEPFNDPLLFFNLSVWQSIEPLRRFVYGNPHVEYVRRRADWCEPVNGPSLVMWWIAESQFPSAEDAIARWQRLQSEGAGRHAFSRLR